MIVKLAPTLAAALAVCAGINLFHATPAAASTSDATTARASLEAFAKIAAVVRSPRCINCHTATGFPRQGDDNHPHRLNVHRGADGHGAAGLPCSTCHGKANNSSSGVPGANEDWHLAPLSMAWEGLSEAEICRELKDPALNGGRDGKKIIEHLGTPLVRWAWSPGSDQGGRPRRSPPLDYDIFVQAADTWVRTGAMCPGP